MNNSPISDSLKTELDLTQDYAVEKAHLQKHFGRKEVLFFTICCLVGVDTIGQIASVGAEAFTWLIILSAVFFIPSGLLFAELGTAFPEEGGPYLWARLAFGRLVASINNFLYWITNPVWFGGTLTIAAIAAVETFFMDGNAMSTIAFYAFGLAFIWIGTFAAILSFKVGKWIPILGAFARFIVLGLFTVALVLYATKNGMHGVHAGDFGVSKSGLVGTLALILFNFVGFENPSSAGDEMKDAQKDIPYSVARSSVAAILLYGVPILGVLLVLPTEQVSGLTGFVDSIKAAFTVFGGSVAADGTATLTGMGAFLGGIAAVLFVLCVLSSGVAWTMGSDRALAVGGYDGSAPRWLGVFSEKYGTPVRVNYISGIVATVILILAHTISGGNTAKYFSVVLGIAISTTLMSYLAIFPSLWKLRVSHPDVHRTYRAPAARFLSTWLTLLIAFATIQLMAPGLGDGWFAGDYTPDGWTTDERWKFLGTELIPVAIFVLLGVVFWMLGKPTRERSGVED